MLTGSGFRDADALACNRITEGFSLSRRKTLQVQSRVGSWGPSCGREYPPSVSIGMRGGGGGGNPLSKAILFSILPKRSKIAHTLELFLSQCRSKESLRVLWYGYDMWIGDPQMGIPTHDYRTQQARQSLPRSVNKPLASLWVQRKGCGRSRNPHRNCCLAVRSWRGRR